MNEVTRKRNTVPMRYKGAWIVGIFVPALTLPFDNMISAQVGFVIFLVGLFISECSLFVAPLPRWSKFVFMAITPLIWIVVILMLAIVLMIFTGLPRD
jgi:hypothetical protein